LLRVVNEMGETSWEGKTRLAVKALCDDKPTNENEFESLYEVDGAVPENTPQERQIRFGHPEKLSILFVAGPPTTESEFEGLITTARTVNNIPGVEVIPIEELQAYEVLKRKWVVLDVKAVEWLTARSKDNDLFEEDEGEEIDVADMTEAEVESRPAA
jgi:large subunit ribosomal protein L4